MAIAEKAPKILIVELDKSDSQPLGSEKELRAAIMGLGNHVGFEELLRRMRVARSILRSRLAQDSEDENRHNLRALIQAFGFVEQQLKQETGRPSEVPREAFEEEQQEYERLAQFVEFVGQNAN